MASNNKVTLAVIGQKVDTLTAIMTEHVVEDKRLFNDIRESLDGCDEYPGVRGRLDRLEQSKKAAVRHFWVIYTAVIAAILSLAASWVG